MSTEVKWCSVNTPLNEERRRWIEIASNGGLGGEFKGLDELKEFLTGVGYFVAEESEYGHLINPQSIYENWKIDVSHAVTGEQVGSLGVGTNDPGRDLQNST